jgi:hypothetical protein
MRSRASAIRRPASASSRGTGAGGPEAGRAKPLTSASAENARPHPETTTTFRSGWASNQAAASLTSRGIRGPIAFSFWGG